MKQSVCYFRCLIITVVAISLAGCPVGPGSVTCKGKRSSGNSKYFDVTVVWNDSGCIHGSVSPHQEYADTWDEAISCTTSYFLIPVHGERDDYQEPANCSGSNDGGSAEPPPKTCDGKTPNGADTYHLFVFDEATKCLIDDVLVYANSKGEALSCNTDAQRFAKAQDDICLYYIQADGPNSCTQVSQVAASKTDAVTCTSMTYSPPSYSLSNNTIWPSPENCLNAKPGPESCD